MDFEEVYEQYFKDVYLYMVLLSRDEKIAEEITQETFFKALKSIHQYDGTKDIRAWLFTIAKNTYFTHHKKSSREVTVEVIEESKMDVELVNSMVNEEESFRIHQFLHAMDEPYKEVFSLRTFGELPFEKIGMLFGKSAGWARVTFYRAKKQIIAYMEENSNGN